MHESEITVKAEDFIRNHLGLPPESKDVDLLTLYDSLDVAQPLRPDIVFRNNSELFFVEIRNSTVTLDTIARMNLQREILHKRTNREVRLVLAAKTINSREEILAKESDIIIIKLPWALTTPKGLEYKSTKIRISSQKSWKIITRLLREKSTSSGNYQ